MFEDKIRKNLKDNEGLIVIIRKYPLVFVVPIVLSATFIIAPFFFLYPLFHWGPWGVSIFFVGLGLGLLLGLRVVVVYSLNVFVITNQRIIDIDQAGFFERTVSETTYDKIQDVSFRIKGVAQTIWHYGSIIIQTAGNQANIELHGVKDPERIQQIITEIQKDTTANSQHRTAEEIVRMLGQMKEKQTNQ